jgi:hypothetical protein
MSAVDEESGATRPFRTRPDAIPLRKVVLGCLAILSLAAAVIHFAVAGSHFQQYWAFGVFMLVAAWLQVLWALAALFRPPRWLLGAGVSINLTVIGVYVITRTVGDVIGPTPHAVEKVGFGDGLCTVLEVILVVGCLWLSTKADREVVPRHYLAVATAATGGMIAVLLSVALVAGGPEMVMGASAAPAMGHGSHASRPVMHMAQMTKAKVAPIRLATSSPAGAITMPMPMMQMMTGMRMASSVRCTARPTAAQQAAAVRLVNTTWKDTRRFRSLAAAQAAGYTPITPPGLPVVHYINYKYYLATAHSGRVLTLKRPQSLVYANTPRGAVLVAAMFITNPGGLTPQPGGCLTQWHVHTNLCQTAFGNVVALVTPATPTCPPGSANHVTPPMMHVWFVPIPGGPTAVDASDAQIVRAAERVKSPPNGTA